MKIRELTGLMTGVTHYVHSFMNSCSRYKKNDTSGELPSSSTRITHNKQTVLRCSSVSLALLTVAASAQITPPMNIEPAQYYEPDTVSGFDAGTNREVRAIAITADNQIGAVGKFNSYDGLYGPNMMFFDEKLDPSTTYNSYSSRPELAFSNSLGQDVVALRDGSFFTYVRNGTNFQTHSFYRVYPNGRRDIIERVGWSSLEITDILPHPTDDNAVYLAARSNTSGAYQIHKMDLTTGQSDPAFNLKRNGTGAATYWRMRINSEGNLVVLQDYLGLREYDPNTGALLDVYEGLTGIGGYRDFDIQSGDRYVIVGVGMTFSGDTSRDYKFVGRLNPDGSLDRSFAPIFSTSEDTDSGGAHEGGIYGVEINDRDEIYPYGDFSHLGSDHVASGGITKLNEDGTFNDEFVGNVRGISQNGHTANNVVEDVVIQPDGKVLVSGNWESFNNLYHQYLVRIHSNGVVDTEINNTPENLASDTGLSVDSAEIISSATFPTSVAPATGLNILSSRGGLNGVAAIYREGEEALYNYAGYHPTSYGRTDYKNTVSSDRSWKFFEAMGDRFLTSNASCTAIRVNVFNTDGSHVWEYNNGNTHIQSIDTSPDGKYVAIGRIQNSTIILDALTGQLLGSVAGTYTGATNFNRSGNYLYNLSWGQYDGLQRIDPATQKVISTLTLPGDFDITNGRIDFINDTEFYYLKRGAAGGTGHIEKLTIVNGLGQPDPNGTTVIRDTSFGNQGILESDLITPGGAADSTTVDPATGNYYVYGKNGNIVEVSPTGEINENYIVSADTSWKDAQNGYNIALDWGTGLAVDTDGDTITDDIDLDDDNDGILDSDEGTADKDGDTVPNLHDLDSDGDGCLDAIEGGDNIQASQLEANGSISGDVDANGVPLLVSGGQAIGGALNSADSSACGENTVAACTDGLDNDGDGLTDCEDPECQALGAPTCNENTAALCSDGLDNDGDGLTDCEDPECQALGAPTCNENTAALCSDGLDNDGDGLTDCEDPECQALGAPTCTEGTAALCSDGLDNDGDGLTDCEDPECQALGSPTCTEGTAALCSDGLDNDGDGLTDCEDPECQALGAPTCTEGTAALCSDGLDNDGDGLTDCEDPECQALGAPTCTEGTVALCSDGLDNDGDGLTDCEDPDCKTLDLCKDTDGDTIPDVDDLDDDNDGIPDTVEEATAGNGGDTDGDTIPDSLDLDSDNDGILDVEEAGHGELDTDGDGRLDGPVGTDGIPDEVQDGLDPNSGAIDYTPVDTDGDGVPDFQDLDSDNDGINDVVESDGVDSNGDGQADGPIDGDGIPSGAGDPVDTDGDTVPDHQDLDSDNDGIDDVIEGGNGAKDLDGDGLVDGPDTDGDGIQDGTDSAPLSFGDFKDPAPTETDGDGVPDFRDLDSDNDGLNDVEEAGLPDPDGNGIVGTGQVPTDTDGDGIADVVDGDPGNFGDADSPATPDTDGDGTPDYQEPAGTPLTGTDGDGDGIIDTVDGNPGGFGDAADTDGDTIPDSEDLDDDNDGIPDTVEEATAGNGGDTDGDTIPDSLDLDSDNDGILDVEEAGHGELDTDGDGRLDGPVGTDGIPDEVQDGQNPDSGIIDYTPVDTDGDGVPDFQDLDSDNDGINDVIESDGVDSNGDGQADGPIDGDGIPAGAGDPVDTDGDTVPDHQDLDSDNDGINDVVEGGNEDPDGDGLINGSDTDGDGILDPVDGSPRAFGDFNDPTVPDTDGDSVPDFRDLDSDNDGINDVEEGPHAGGDTNGDGLVDGPDTDGDGIMDAADGDPVTFGDFNDPTTPDTDGDGTPDYQEPAGTPLTGPDTDGDGILDQVDGLDGFGDTPVDTDGDTIPDNVDLDDDNDGIPDTVEEATAGNGGDTDGDTIPDSLDLDADNDGILDVVEAGHGELDTDGDGRLDGPVGTDGIPDEVQDGQDTNGGSIDYTPVDTDGDGVPDFQDLDSDNDGINDVIESNGVDANGDGQADDPVDVNGIPGSAGPSGNPEVDTDGDTIPDQEDLDSDNDGINDVEEAGLPDPDGNGIVGEGQVPTDSDGDGIADVVDGDPVNFGDFNDPTVPDTDGDSVPDFRDLDSDNDSISDVIEGGNEVADLDGDGTISPEESGDVDGDGIPDAVDEDINNFGDAGDLASPDTDGDTIPDYLDVDSDGDGVNDITEAGNGGLDPDGDGTIDNPTDPDGDGIPNNINPETGEPNDTKPTGFAGATTPSVQSACAAFPYTADNDGDVFTLTEEYAFGGSPEDGAHVLRDYPSYTQGLVLEEQADGTVDAKITKPTAVTDATYTLQGILHLETSVMDGSHDEWTDLPAPSVVDNGDGTETLVWEDLQSVSPMTTEKGFVRAYVTTPCDPSGTYTTVEGWTLLNIEDRLQTEGVSLVNDATFTGAVDSSSGATVMFTNASVNTDFAALIADGTYYLEVTSGEHEGQRFDIASGATGSLTLDTGSEHNTSSSVPSLAGSNVVIRKHNTLGDLYINAEYDASSSSSGADQVQIYDGEGYRIFYNIARLGFWVEYGKVDEGSKNDVIIPPGDGVFVKHALPSDDNLELRVGSVRYNDFVRPLDARPDGPGLNHIALGFPVDSSPAMLAMTTASNSFVSSLSQSNADQIHTWVGDDVPNTREYDRYFNVTADGAWAQVGSSGEHSGTRMFKLNRAAFVDSVTDKVDWTHPLPYSLEGWTQPEVGHTLSQ